VLNVGFACIPHTFEQKNSSDLMQQGGVTWCTGRPRQRRPKEKWRSITAAPRLEQTTPATAWGRVAREGKFTMVPIRKSVHNCTLLKSRDCSFRKEVAQTLLPLRHQRSKSDRGSQWPRSSFTFPLFDEEQNTAAPIQESVQICSVVQYVGIAWDDEFWPLVVDNWPTAGLCASNRSGWT